MFAHGHASLARTYNEHLCFLECHFRILVWRSWSTRRQRKQARVGTRTAGIKTRENGAQPFGVTSNEPTRVVVLMPPKAFVAIESIIINRNG
jgi:hypothetical protein